MKQDLKIVKALIKEMYEGSTCNECGAPMYEGKCMECGYMEEDVKTPNPPTDYAGNPAIPGLGPIVGTEGKKKLSIKQKYIAKQAPPKNKITGKDFEMLRAKNENHEGQDHEVSMAKNSIDSILWAANELKKHLQGGERDIPAWIQDHITNAENYILQAAKNYHEYGHEEAPEEEPADDNMSLSSLMEAKKKPSAGLTKKQKSAVAKKAKAGKDIGAKGKGFEKIAKKAAKKYGSEERGKKVAAAAMWKNVKRK